MNSCSHQDIVRAFGSDPLACSTLQPGLEYFEQAGGFIAYERVLGRRFVLGNPVCAPEARAELVRAFLRGGPPAQFCCISEDFARELELLPERPFFFAAMGVERVVRVADLAPDRCPSLSAASREADNAELELLPVDWHGPGAAMVERLREIAEAFREGRNADTEMRFLNRPMWFHHDGLTRTYGLSRRMDGQRGLFGFVTLDPYFAAGRVRGYQLSILRYERTRLRLLPTVLARLHALLAEDGIEELSLGFSPFHRLLLPGELRASFLLGKQLEWIEKLRPYVPTLDSQRALKDAVPGRDRQRFAAVGSSTSVLFPLRMAVASGLRLGSVLPLPRILARRPLQQSAPAALAGVRAARVLLELSSPSRPRTLQRLVERYGHVVQLRLGRDFLLVNRPDGLQHVLADNARNFVNAERPEGPHLLLGAGGWTSLDRSPPPSRPMPSREQLRRAVQVLSDEAEGLLGSWRATAARGEPVNAWSAVARLGRSGARGGPFAMDAGTDGEAPAPNGVPQDGEDEAEASALGWLLYLLATHPEARERIHGEARRLGDGPLCPKALSTMTYTRQAADEALRLYPPVWAFSRKALRPARVCGLAVAEGTTLWLVPYLLHRHPGYWARPNAFEPELHFSPEAVGARARFAYLPFGREAQRCPRVALARLGMLVFLARLLARHDIELSSQRRAVPEARGALRPKDEVWIHVRDR